jgi:hypothetical protein
MDPTDPAPIIRVYNKGLGEMPKSDTSKLSNMVEDVVALVAYIYRWQIALYGPTASTLTLPEELSGMTKARWRLYQAIMMNPEQARVCI